MCYTLFSSAVGVISAYLSGYIFGFRELEEIDVELLAPCVRRFYRVNYTSVELDETQLKSGIQKS